MQTQAARAEALARRLGEVRDSELFVGGAPVSDLAQAFGTPFYLYSGDTLSRRVREVRAAIGPETDLCFSIKANPSLGFCQVLAREGVGAEVASSGELALGLRAGFSGRTMLFAGPGKTDAELEAAVRANLLAVNAESAGEMERLARVAQRMGTTASAALRVNPTGAVQGARMRMGGGPQQFGIDEESVPEIASAFRTHPHLELIGIHVYAGTQIFDVDTLLVQFHHTVDIALRLADTLERPLQVIDFGGGFGVPYFEGMPEFDLNAFAAGYREVVQRCRADERVAGARLVIELGRYLAAEAGVYVTRVVDVKVSRGRTFVIADGGMNHHIMATGNFGQVFRKPYPLAPLTRLGDTATDTMAIAGPCCTPLDIFGQQVLSPSVEVGDLIGVFYSGAYGYSASSLGFLSHPTPAEVLVWNGQVHLLRPPGGPAQVLEGQLPLEENAREPGLPVGIHSK